MIGMLILAAILVMAPETRGWGLILLGLALYSDPRMFAGLLIISGILLLPSK
jgi:hypothetical protein